MPRRDRHQPLPDVCSPGCTRGRTRLLLAAAVAVTTLVAAACAPPAPDTGPAPASPEAVTHANNPTRIDDGPLVRFVDEDARREFEAATPAGPGAGANLSTDDGWTPWDVNGRRLFLRRTGYTIRLVTSTNIESYRASLVTTAQDLTRHTGIPFTVAAGQVGGTPDDGVAGEIRVMVSPDPNRCGANALACAGPAILGNGEIHWGVVWIIRTEGFDVLHILEHEFGHVAGLAHHDSLYQGKVQVMSSISGDAPVFQAGDINGLRFMARPPVGARQVATGSSHTCAATTAGAALCWGANNVGQLGATGWPTPTRTPVPVSGLGTGVAAIAAGADHNCALTTAGQVRCWGRNDAGQSNPGQTGTTPTPVAVPLRAAATSISLGRSHSCARLVDATVQCWGRSTDGAGGAVVSVDAGGDTSCALLDGTAVARCWGANPGDLILSSSGASTTPRSISGLGDAALNEVSMGDRHACARTTRNYVKCWGAGASGQLGSGANTDSRVALNVAALDGATSLSVAGDVSCAVAAGGVRCWGANGAGQLGNGSTTAANRPVAVSGLSSGVAQVSTSGTHTCAVRTTGALWCWGATGSGQIGPNAPENRTTPIEVLLYDLGGL